jgi:hypothetical protein
MKKNVGEIDRTLRLIIVLLSGFLAYKFEFTDWKSFALAGLSIIALVTALTKSCPLYYLFNMSTYKFEL